MAKSGPGVSNNPVMSTPRIFHPEPLSTGATIELTESAATHVTRVLRLEAGERLVLFNGDGHDYAGQIDSGRQRSVRVTLNAAAPSTREPGIETTLLQGICRGQRMDLVIQKATELGVTGIRPISCERSVVRLQPERARRRQAHWRGVTISAAEQCGRATLPQVHGPASLDEALAELDSSGSRVMLDPDADLDLGAALAAGPPVTLLCGPEGGLSEFERSLATRAGFIGARLGPRTLRTETAPIAALAIIQYLRGDFGSGR
ncbi:MAG: 16S rRNA (uracil(1498)-N(3))-methyltransferase [Gammaproteobacteria bacterium]|nr:16S rRNA (uracil(1498)-N(3))-methyltransferase [Gammaproteobacteria bacterium]